MSDLTPGSITPSEWAGILENAVQSHQPGGDHKYIAVHDGKTYQVMKGSALETSDVKLSISKIVDTSKKELADLTAQHKAKKVSDKDYEELSKKIYQYTDKLIDERAAKRNTIGLQLLRGIAYVISAITSLLLVGIPFLVKLRKNDADFEKEIASFKETVRQPTAEALNVLKQKKIDVLIEEQLGRIPSILDDVKKGITPEDRLNLLQKLTNGLYPKNENEKVIYQFEKDILRGVSFYIEGDTPRPSPDLKGENRIESAVTYLNGLLAEKEADKRWSIPLQLIVNQTCLNNIFDMSILLFNMGPDGRGVTWQEPQTGTEYALKAAFSEHLPPIKLEVVRNEKTGEIDKVNIVVHGFIDIIKFRTTGKAGSEGIEDDQEKTMIAPEAIEGNLTYTVTLDKQGRPVISNLEASLKATQPGTTEKVE